MPETVITTIRLTEEDRKEADRKAAAYGLPTLSALVRFAVKQLKEPKKS